MPPESVTEEDATGARDDGGAVAVDDLPAEVEDLLGAAGVEWPYLNEKALRAFVRALRGFRGGMLRIHLDATDSLARIAREQSPDGAEETLQDWDDTAAAYVFGIADDIESFCRGFEDWVAVITVEKSSLLERLRTLAAEAAMETSRVGVGGGGTAAPPAPKVGIGTRVDEVYQCAKNLLADLDSKLEREAGVMFGERLAPLLGRIAESAHAVGGTSSLLRGEGTFAPGADIETVYLHIDRFRGFAEAMTECSRALMASMRGLDFGARPEPGSGSVSGSVSGLAGLDADAVGMDAVGTDLVTRDADDPVSDDDEPAEGFAVWRGHTYRAERVTHSAVRLSLMPGDTRPPVAPELGSWPYTGSLLLWPAQLDTWFGPAKPGPTKSPTAASSPATSSVETRTDLLELWRLRFAEEAFRYFTPAIAEPGSPARARVADGPCVVGEFARWRGRVYGAQSMPDDSARLFPLPGDDRTPVVPDLARHARGLWASPIELEEWYAVCTTFYVGDDAYVALWLDGGVVEGLRAYTADPTRERFPVGRVTDLQEERRDLLAEWKWKTGI
jgi:hypothetical protein